MLGNPKVMHAVAQQVLVYCNTALDELDRVFAASKATIQAESTAASDGGGLSRSTSESSAVRVAAAQRAHKVMRAGCRRLEAVIEVLATCVGTTLTVPSFLETEMKAVLHTYKLLGNVVRYHTPAKGAQAMVLMWY